MSGRVLTRRIENLQVGEIGLVDASGRCLAFNVGGTGENGQTLVLSNDSLRPSGRAEIYSLILMPTEARGWPSAVVFKDAELSPDIASLTCGFDIPERALVPTSAGQLHLAVKINGWSNAFFDPESGLVSDFSPERTSWYFTKWDLTVPKPTNPGVREAIFSVALN